MNYSDFENLNAIKSYNRFFKKLARFTTYNIRLNQYSRVESSSVSTVEKLSSKASKYSNFKKNIWYIEEIMRGGEVMPEVLLICRDGLASSIASSLIFAIGAKRTGVNIGVFFTQEALQAIAENKFELSPLLKEHMDKIARNAKGMGLLTDPMLLLKSASNAGVALFACPIWVGLLELKGKLPAQIMEIDIPTALKTILEAKKIIGSF
jgi:peroxiredoxin family protein